MAGRQANIPNEAKPFTVRRNAVTGLWDILRVNMAERIDDVGHQAEPELWGSFPTEQEAERELQWIVKDLNREILLQKKGRANGRSIQGHGQQGVERDATDDIDSDCA